MTDLSNTIRRATAADAYAIAAVHVASWHTTYAGVVDQSYIDRLSVDDRATAWRERLNNGSTAAPDVLLAESLESGIIGFASGGHVRQPEDGFDAELHAIYLLTPSR